MAPDLVLPLDLDHIPLSERRRRLLLLAAAPSRCQIDTITGDVAGGALQEWSGLPRGAQFNPSDRDLLWHLCTKVGIGNTYPHPFIGLFIKSLDEERRFGYTHPLNLPGVKQDGRASYFFHKTCKSYNNENHRYMRWQKMGKPTPVSLDGSPQGCKEVFVLYTCTTNDDTPQETNWRLHQYRIGNAIKEEEELVVSKLFYKSSANHRELGRKPPVASVQDASVTRNDSCEESPAEVGCADITTGGNIIQGLAIEEDMDILARRQKEKDPNENKIRSCKESLFDTNLNQGRRMNNHPEVKEFNYVTLNERYRILSANRHHCSSSLNALVSAENSGINGLEDSYRNHAGKVHGDDIYSMLKGISSGPSVVASISEGDTGRLQGDFSSIQICPRKGLVDSVTCRTASNTPVDSTLNSTVGVSHCTESSANGQHNLALQCGLPQQTRETEESVNPICRTRNLDILVPDSFVKAEASTNDSNCETNGPTQFIAGHAEQENDKKFDLASPTITSDAELLRSSVISCSQNGNVQLLHKEPSTCLVGVKLEPSWQGKINFTQFALEKSHFFSENGCSRHTASAVPECLPTSGQMDPLQGSDTAGCTESHSSEEFQRILADDYQIGSTHARDPIQPVGVKCERTLSEFYGLCEGNPLNISQPKKGEEHARSLNLGEDTACCSRQRKRRKTVTNSVETALEEDAPGLLQILLQRGIMVEEIKLYGIEEDDGLLPDCTESDFEDLEAVITKLFSRRASLLKFATAKHAKGTKAVYCLACLISLIEQTRYLQFRDTPVEWGWCRDLQSFIFVFKSHNRIVLERPEYGYATYFFEVVELLPVEWQIRRLVTAMKLTSCGRTTLIENKPLLVGEDLSEGEAKVLETYGWTPNTGLGTMLNYCDRVMHDRKTETYNSEWRVKIGKMLMNGFVGGRSVLSNLPEKIEGLARDGSTEIKLENPV